jgi:hypothetical protein
MSPAPANTRRCAATPGARHADRSLPALVSSAWDFIASPMRRDRPSRPGLKPSGTRNQQQIRRVVGHQAQAHGSKFKVHNSFFPLKLMLFHSSIRKELARTFGATLVVLITIVMTIILIRTLGQASRGVVNPSEVMMVMGFSVLGVLAGTADTQSLHRDCRHAFPHVCRERDGDLAFKRPWSGGLHFPPVVVCVAGPVCRHRAGAADLALDQSAGA